MNPISQRDPRWSKVLLGYSKTSTIGLYGCTITAIAHCLGLTPPVVNDKMKAAGAFQDDLVLWYKLKAALGFLEFQVKAAYNNTAVKAALANKDFVLVEVDFDSSISTPRDSHWVRYLGDQKMMDPWTGEIKSTSVYPLVKNYVILKNLQKEVVVQPAPSPTPVLSVTMPKDQDLFYINEAIGSMEWQAIRSRVIDASKPQPSNTIEIATLQSKLNRIHEESRI